MTRHFDLGVISKERLRNIPKPLRALHEATFFFHDLAVSALKQYDRPDLRSIAFESKALAAIPREELSAMDGIDLLRRIDKDDDARRLMLNECILALVSDGLQFICEALFSYEKGKINVSLNLLRKPMKENVLYLEWILANDEEFFHSFSSPNRREMNIGAISPEKRLSIIRDAINRLSCHGPFTAEMLYTLRYDKSNAFMEPLWHKASHLVTTQNANFTTEPENFNMIFANEDVRCGIYEAIAKWYLLLVMYYYSVSVSALGRLHPHHTGTLFYNDVCSLIGSSLIIGDWKSAHPVLGELTNLINQLSCGKCSNKFHVDEKAVARSFFSRTLPCAICKCDIDCDLYDLMQLRKRHTTLEMN